MALSKEVTQYLDEQNHPFRQEIEALRTIILEACDALTENIKWNGPNYAIGAEDRITMKIQPPKQVQLVFHRGAKVKEAPTEKLVQDDSKLLDWKGNDRAVATFKTIDSVTENQSRLTQIVQDWIASA